MEAEDVCRIQKRRKILTDNIVPRFLYDRLIQEGVFDVKDKEEIQERYFSNQEKASGLLDRVLTRGPDAYRAFHDALEENYPFLAAALDDTQITERDKQQYASIFGSESNGNETPANRERQIRRLLAHEKIVKGAGELLEQLDMRERECDQLKMTTNNQVQVNNCNIDDLTQQNATQQQQLARKDQEIARKDQEMAIKDREIAKKDQEIAIQDKEMSRKQLQHDRELAKKDREIKELKKKSSITATINTPLKREQATRKALEQSVQVKPVNACYRYCMGRGCVRCKVLPLVEAALASGKLCQRDKAMCQERLTEIKSREMTVQEARQWVWLWGCSYGSQCYQQRNRIRTAICALGR